MRCAGKGEKGEEVGARRAVARNRREGPRTSCPVMPPNSDAAAGGKRGKKEKGEDKGAAINVPVDFACRPFDQNIDPYVRRNPQEGRKKKGRKGFAPQIRVFQNDDWLVNNRSFPVVLAAQKRKKGGKGKKMGAAQISRLRGS